MGKYSLIIVAGFAFSFGIIQNNINQVNGHFVDLVVNDFDRTMARSVASSGAQMALAQLTLDGNWRAGWSGKSVAEGLSSVQLVDNTSDTTMAFNEIRVVSTSTYGDAADTAIVMWQRVAFSEYAYFTDYEPTIYFITGDSLAGPVHTNGTFHVSGDPVFAGKVTSPNTWVGSGSPQFLGGADFNHSEVELPMDLDGVTAAAQDGGAYFSLAGNKELWLDFQVDGSVNHVVLDEGTVPSGGTTWSNLDLSIINGVIVCSREVHIQGTVNGRVTVGSLGDVYIENDIVYAADPRLGASDDIMGIMSQGQIIVADNSANRTNVEIHASLLALDKFTVEDHDAGSPRGTLEVLGGIVQDTRGAVGTFSGGTIASGYHKDYEYDERLKLSMPPYFPLAGDNAGPGTVYPGNMASWYE